jgi:hypothetical protein
MTTETNRALELLRQCNDLLECSFWAASTEEDARGQGISGTIIAAQDKLEAAVALLNGEPVNKPEQEGS